jgi:hypothetical protein
MIESAENPTEPRTVVEDSGFSKQAEEIVAGASASGDAGGATDSNGRFCQQALIVWDFLHQHHCKSARHSDLKVLFGKFPLRQTWESNQSTGKKQSNGDRQRSGGSSPSKTRCNLNSSSFVRLIQMDLCKGTHSLCKPESVEPISQCTLDLDELQREVENLK